MTLKLELWLPLPRKILFTRFAFFVRAIGYTRSNIIETLLERLEEHARELEATVEERTRDLVEEKKKTDQLLFSLLPRLATHTGFIR